MKPTAMPAAGLLAAGLLLAALPARAEVVDIDWQGGGQFSRQMTLAPGQFAELCGPLAAGKRVAWWFEADAALNFNIHFHVGKAVHYPARQDRVRQLAGELAVDQAQDYCWMWTNKSTAAAQLSARLQLQ